MGRGQAIPRRGTKPQEGVRGNLRSRFPPRRHGRTRGGSVPSEDAQRPRVIRMGVSDECPGPSTRIGGGGGWVGGAATSTGRAGARGVWGDAPQEGEHGRSTHGPEASPRGFIMRGPFAIRPSLFGRIGRNAHPDDPRRTRRRRPCRKSGDDPRRSDREGFSPKRALRAGAEGAGRWGTVIMRVTPGLPVPSVPPASEPSGAGGPFLVVSVFHYRLR